MTEAVFGMDNPAWAGLVLYGTLLLVKTALMSMVTAVFRSKHRSFATAEDAKTISDDPDKVKQLLQPNASVERVRHAHLNDLENVIPFVLLGVLYVATNPAPATAILHFQVFFGARVFHSIAYLGEIRQPARALGFLVGFVCFFSMAVRILMAVM